MPKFEDRDINSEVLVSRALYNKVRRRKPESVDYLLRFTNFRDDRPGTMWQIWNMGKNKYRAVQIFCLEDMIPKMFLLGERTYSYNLGGNYDEEYSFAKSTPKKVWVLNNTEMIIAKVSGLI